MNTFSRREKFHVFLCQMEAVADVVVLMILQVRRCRAIQFLCYVVEGFPYQTTSPTIGLFVTWFQVAGVPAVLLPVGSAPLIVIRTLPYAK